MRAMTANGGGAGRRGDEKSFDRLWRMDEPAHLLGSGSLPSASDQVST